MKFWQNIICWSNTFLLALLFRLSDNVHSTLYKLMLSILLFDHSQVKWKYSMGNLLSMSLLLLSMEKKDWNCKIELIFIFYVCAYFYLLWITRCSFYLEHYWNFVKSCEGSRETSARHGCEPSPCRHLQRCGENIHSGTQVANQY